MSQLVITDFNSSMLSSCCRTRMGFTLASSKFRWNYADRSLCSLPRARGGVLTAIMKLLFTCRRAVWIPFTSAAPILFVKLSRPCSKSFLWLTTLRSLHFINAVTRKTKVQVRLVAFWWWRGLGRELCHRNTWNKQGGRTHKWGWQSCSLLSLLVMKSSMCKSKWFGDISG